MNESSNDDSSPPTAQMESNANQGAQSKSLNKACEPCRTSKLRCFIDPASEDGRCKRCVATRRNCVFNAPQVRQRRAVRTDTRVAELERQLRALRMKLDSQQSGRISDPDTPSSSNSGWKFEAPLTPGSWSQTKLSGQVRSDPSGVGSDGVASDPSREAPLEQSLGAVSSGDDPTANDVISRKLLTWQHAEELFGLFVNHFAPKYPFVALPPQSRLQDVRAQRPATFLSILAATSSTSTPELNRKLNKELLTMFALRMMLEGDRTLDLVQAMVIMTVWYSPSERLESLKHYQFAHNAANMAMDIGVADENKELDAPNEEPQQLDLDRRRTLLACYLLCTGISLATGRPIMLRWSPYMESSCNRIISLPNAPLSDYRLVAWVKLQRLAEKAVDRFFSGKEPLDITDPDSQNKVTRYIEELDQWKRDCNVELDGSFGVHHNQVRSRVLCVCLYPDHPFEDFRPPFRIRHLNSKMAIPPKLTPFFARTVLSLVEAVQDALESFLNMPTIDILAAPIITYVRTTHALSVLLMLAMASIRPGNQLSMILDQSALKLDHYFAALQTTVSSAIGPVGCKTPTKYIAIVKQMEDWWRAQNQDPAGQAYDLRPFMSVLPQGRKSKAAQSVETIMANGVPAVNPDLSSGATWNTSPDPSIISSNSSDLQFFPIDPPGTSSDQAISPFNTWMLDVDPDMSGMGMPEIDWNMFDVDGLAEPNVLFE